MRVLVTGASRGIGAAVARAFARAHGPDCSVALLARSLAVPSHDGLAGTLADTARDVEAHGARAVAFGVDFRDGERVRGAVRDAVHELGGLDVLVNNASALWARPRVSPKTMDLMLHVNTRSTLVCLQECADALEASEGAVVSLSPPVRPGRLEWLADHPAYTVSKYGMTLATLSAATDRVRANCLWPRHLVATAATRSLESVVPGAFTKGRPPDDVARAVHSLALRRDLNARTLLDDEVLALPPTEAPLDAFVDAVRPTVVSAC